MEHSKVVVIGGGPAGSTAASLLAREGVEVLLLERDHFPRYHIGESILPAIHPMLDLLGASEKVAAQGYRKKTGQYFNWGTERWDYRFGALSGQLVTSYQVERADFDKLMLDHAREQGVDVREGHRVTEVHFDGDRPTSLTYQNTDTGEQGRVSFDYLIDASGRTGILVNRYLGGRTMNESFRNVAVWGYWKDAKELPHAPEGATVVSAVEEGWVWLIPLRDQMSVGIVLHRDRFQRLKEENGDLEGFYQAMLDRAGEVPDILDGATRVDEGLRVDQDYSYTAERYCGPGYFICGDAACFLDPLLSTGVHLGHFSALLAAASIVTLERKELDQQTVENFYNESYRRTYLRFLLVVAAVYRQYDGKETYFWQAQRLVGDKGKDVTTPSRTFLNVVTGTTDMAEITAREVSPEAVEHAAETYRRLAEALKDHSKGKEMTEAEREQAKATAQYWNSYASTFSTRPDRAVEGLYVSTENGLAIRRSDAA